MRRGGARPGRGEGRAAGYAGSNVVSSSATPRRSEDRFGGSELSFVLVMWRLQDPQYEAARDEEAGGRKTHQDRAPVAQLTPGASHADSASR